jgi:hypothetical protein
MQRMLGLATGSTQPTHGFPEYAMMRWIDEMLAYTAPAHHVAVRSGAT